MARRPLRTIYQKTLPGFAPVPVVGKAVVMRITNARSDPAVQMPIPPASDRFRQATLSIAETYTEMAKVILEDLTPRIEAVADEIEEANHFSERIQELRHAAAALGHLFGELASRARNDNPADEPLRPREIYPSSKHSRAGQSSPTKVTTAEAQLELTTAVGFLARALTELDKVQDDPEIAPLLQELGEVRPSTLGASGGGGT